MLRSRTRLKMNILNSFNKPPCISHADCDLDLRTVGGLRFPDSSRSSTSGVSDFAVEVVNNAATPSERTACHFGRRDPSKSDQTRQDRTACACRPLSRREYLTTAAHHIHQRRDVTRTLVSRDPPGGPIADRTEMFAGQRLQNYTFRSLF